MSAPDTDNPSKEETMDDLYEQLSALVGQQVEIYGRSDYTVVAVHSREAKIEAPKTRKFAASVKYPKLRTLEAAVALMNQPAEEPATKPEAVTA